MNRQFLARLLTPALLAAAIWSSYLFWHEGVRKDRTPIDFFVFYEAGERVAAGHGAYDNHLDPRRAYVYPQALAHFLARTHVPLGRDGAERLWKGISLLALAAGLIVGVAWGTRVAGMSPPPSDRARIALCAVSVGLGFSPIVFGWRLGQADLVIVGLLAPVLLVRSPRGAWIAGLLIGVGGVLKLSPLFLLPGLVLCLGWRVAAGAAVAMLAYGLWLWGHGLLAHEGLLYAERIPFFKYRNSYPASSLQAMATALFDHDRFLAPSGFYHGPVTTATTAVVCAAYAGAGLWAWRMRSGVLAMFALSMVFARLVSPFLEPHHHSPSVVPLMGLGTLAIMRRDGAMGAWVLAAWYAGMLFVPVGEVVGGRWPALLLIASDLLLLGAAFRYRRVDGESSLAPGGAWLGRFRVPVSDTRPTALPGGPPAPAKTGPRQGASPSGGS